MRSLGIVSALCFAAAAVLAQTGNRGVTVAPRDATHFLQEKKLALLVGIDDYQEETGLSKLKYAVNDVKDLAEALKAHGYLTDVLTDGRAIKVTIRRHLQDMLARIEPNSGTVLFAFSGHGGKAGGADYLATADAAADSLDRDGLAVDWIKAQLAESNAPRKMMFLDACRNVTSPGGKDSAPPIAPFARLSESKGLRMLISTAEGTRSYESDELRHGVFTYYLLDGLNGSAAGPDGLITFNRLADYVTGKVKETRPGQVPYTDGQYSGDFYLGGEFKAPPPPAPANPVRTLPHLIYGAWTLRRSVDDQGNDWSNSTLKFTSQEETADGLLLKGTFTWRRSNLVVGTEQFTGHYVADTRQLLLEGVSVSDRLLAIGSYSGVLSPDERTIVDGRWGSTLLKDDPGVPGRWEAFR